MPDNPLNAWDEEIEDESPEDDPYWVPPEERKDTDADPEAVALVDPETGETSDDMEEWEPTEPEQPEQPEQPE